MVKRRVWKGVGTLVLAGGLLAACGDEEQAQVTTSKETTETTETVEAIEVIEESEAEKTVEESGSQQESQQYFYNNEDLEEEIAEHFIGYELPREGIVEESNVSILYENGMFFQKEYKEYRGVRAGPGTLDRDKSFSNLDVMPGQEKGVVIGLLFTSAQILYEDIEDGSWAYILFKEAMAEAQQWNDYKPLNDYINARIEGVDLAIQLEGQDLEDAVSIESRELYSLLDEMKDVLR